MYFAHRVLKNQQHAYNSTTSLRTACTCTLDTASNHTMSRGPSIQTKQGNRQQVQIKKVSNIITVSVTVQCTSKAQQVISHARPSLCNLLLSCFSSFSYPFFRNRIAISSYSSCARCQANASSQHKRGKVDSNTACAVHLVCPTAGCSSSRAK